MTDVLAVSWVDTQGTTIATERDTMATDFKLGAVTEPILLHLIGKELRFPRLFLWRCAATVESFKNTIDPRFPRELVELAALPLWVYIHLKKKIGRTKAFETMRVAILTGGLAQWNLAYETVTRERTFKNLCDQELVVSKTGPTKWNTLKVVERTEHRFEIRVTRCLYHELSTAVGVPEFTPVVCQLDSAGFNSYLPDKVVFHRGGPNRRIADGAKECHFIWELKE